MRALIHSDETREHYLNVRWPLVAGGSIGMTATLGVISHFTPEIPFVVDEGLHVSDDKSDLIVVMNDLPTTDVTQRDVESTDAPREAFVYETVVPISNSGDATEVADAILSAVPAIVSEFGDEVVVDAFVYNPQDVSVSAVDSSFQVLPSQSGTVSGTLESYALKLGSDEGSNTEQVDDVYRSIDEQNGDGTLPLIFPQYNATFPARYSAEQFTRLVEVIEKHNLPDFIVLQAALSSENSDSELVGDVEEAILQAPHSNFDSPQVMLRVSDSGNTDPTSINQSGMTVDSYCEVVAELTTTTYKGLEAETRIDPLFAGPVVGALVMALATKRFSRRREVNGVLVPHLVMQERVENGEAATIEKLTVLRYRQALFSAKIDDLKIRQPHRFAKLLRIGVGALAATTAFGMAKFISSTIQEKPTVLDYDTTNILDNCDSLAPISFPETEKPVRNRDGLIPSELIDEVQKTVFEGSVDTSMK